MPLFDANNGGVFESNPHQVFVNNDNITSIPQLPAVDISTLLGSNPFNTSASSNPETPQEKIDVKRFIQLSYIKSLQTSEEHKKLSALDIWENHETQLQKDLIAIRSRKDSFISNELAEFNATMGATVNCLLDETAHTLHLYTQSKITHSIARIRQKIRPNRHYPRISHKPRDR